MKNNSDPIDALLWIELPENIERDINGFLLDPGIPLPIEPQGEGTSISQESLTWERIIAAILLVLANQPSHENAQYYRDLVNILRPNLPEELSQASLTCIKDQEWTQAEEILLALRGLEPEISSHRLALATLYGSRSVMEEKNGRSQIAQNYHDAAEAAFTEILSDDQVPIEAWFQAGVFHFNKGKYIQAAEALEIYLNSGKEEEHGSEAARLVGLCRQEGLADKLYQEAYKDLVNNRTAEGIEKARQFLENRPQGWTGWFLLGWGLRLAGRWEEACKALNQAKELGGREADLWNELAICSQECGDLAGAEEALKAALQKDPENTKILSNMAVLKKQQGQQKEARRLLETALILEPGDFLARQLLQEMEKEAPSGPQSPIKG